MAYTTVATAVTGQVYLAASWNTEVKDNMAALWPFTTAGDISYATSGTTLGRLGIGSAAQVLTVETGVPKWKTPTSGTTLQDVYPVGSVYMSTSATSPATTFGFGTWSAVQGRMLIGADGTYTGGSTGGAATVTLSAAEMPVHTHTQNAHNHTQDAHQHTVGMTLTYYRDGSGSNDQRGIAGSINTSSVAATNQAATATNQNSGSGTAHENLPPYLAVYIWTRTA